MTPRVESFAWNPRRSIKLPVLRRAAIGPRVNNFGDLVGPIVVDLVRSRLLLSDRSSSGLPVRLFSVGSVLHFAQDGDVVWGSGVNGKIDAERHRWRALDVRAVRGPLSRRWVESFSGQDVPEVYGDPALLLFELGYPRPERASRRGVTFIPNLNDPRRPLPPSSSISPRTPLRNVLTAIAESETVVTSSLHALVFAELLKVPVALMTPPAESPFKYQDYARGTGRDDLPMFDDFARASTHASSSTYREEDALGAWRSRALLEAFPADRFLPLAVSERGGA